MNLQDIENIFWGDRREQPTSVRLARVVRALRDEISKHDYLREVDFMLNQILSDAGEKVAIKETAVGAVLRLEAGDPPLPATNTAPAVCEWRRTDESGWAHDHGWTGQFAFGHEPPKNCHRCGKPIAFAEAAPPSISTPTPKRVSIGVDPNKNCQWDPVKDSDRLWFAWCKTQPGIREYQIAPRACPVCNLPVKTMEGAL